MICVYFVRGELPTLGIYITDTSREIDRLSRDKLSVYETNIMHEI